MAPPGSIGSSARERFWTSSAGRWTRTKVEHVADRAQRRSTALVRRLTPHLEPRVWSNREVEPIAAGITGDVIHVSAWRDDDKHGRTYRDYFARARSYTTTNVGGQRGELEGADLPLDLSVPLPVELEGAYDLAFNHTTLEHVYEIETALDALFGLTRDQLLVVIPFMQVEHWERPSFADHWRMTRFSLTRACVDRGFEVLSLTSNHNAVWPIYYCLHARRVPGGLPPGADQWGGDDIEDGFGFRPVAPGHPSMM
jgi:hypothetical protein